MKLPLPSGVSLSIRTVMLVPLLLLAIFTVGTLSYLTTSSVRRQAAYSEKISSEALLSQAQEYLLQLNTSSARENDLIFKTIMDEGAKMAAFTASVFDHPDAFSTASFFPSDTRLFKGEGGQLMNALEDTSSVLVPNFRALDPDVRRDVELGAYLDLLFEGTFRSTPNIVAIYFSTPRDVTRYYPNIGLGSVVPPDFAATKRVWYSGSTPENNPLGASWWTPVYIDATGRGLVTTAAIPVYIKSGQMAGVIGLDVTLQEMVANIESKRVLQSGYSFMIDRSGKAIALPPEGYRDILGREPKENEINSDISSSPTGFAVVIRKMMAGELGVERMLVRGEEVYVAYAPLENTGWSLASIVQSDEILKAVILLEEEIEQNSRSLLLTIILPLSAAILVVVVLLVLALTKFITSPIDRLVAAVQKLNHGEWNVDLPSSKYQEISSLAVAFGTMVNEIRMMVMELENRVLARTHDLERRSNQIQAAAEVARDATASLNMNELLNRAVNLVCERFGFYHAGIFLINEMGDEAVLRAATGEAGKAMLTSGHQLKVAEVGIVGYVTSTGQPRIALDVGVDPVHFKNPLLPETRSELALPLVSGQKVIGALDVQSRLPNAFDEEDITVLQIMADQLAVAIENARLYEEVQGNLEKLVSLYGHFNQEAWMKAERTASVSGFKFDSEGVTPLPEDKSLSGSSPREAPIFVPLKVGDLAIGSLEVWPVQEELSKEEEFILDAVGERISLALESARLFEESRARIRREQTLNQMVSRFAQSLDFETLMQAAVTEIGRLPNVAEVSIHVSPPEEDSTVGGNGHFQPGIEQP